MSVFVDSSAFYAAADNGDHSSAQTRELLSAGEDLLTTDHVLVESWLLLSAVWGSTPPTGSAPARLTSST